MIPQYMLRSGSPSYSYVKAADGSGWSELNKGLLPVVASKSRIQPVSAETLEKACRPSFKRAASRQSTIYTVREGAQMHYVVIARPQPAAADWRSVKHSLFVGGSDDVFKKQLRSDLARYTEVESSFSEACVLAEAEAMDTPGERSGEISFESVSMGELFERSHDLRNKARSRPLSRSDQYLLERIEEELDRREFELPESKAALGAIDEDIKRLDTMAEIGRLLASLAG